MSTLLQTIKLIDATHDYGIIGLRPTAILADDESPDACWGVRWEIETLASNTVCTRAWITNTGTTPLRVKGIRWGCDPAEENGPALRFPPALEPHVFATENLRGDYFGSGTVEGDRFAYPLTNQHIEYGNAEDHVFPGVFVAAAKMPAGLLIAQASQQRFYALFRFLGRMLGRQNWLFEIEERANGVTAYELAPGAALDGEKWLFHLAPTNDPQQATAAYFQVLHSDGAFARRALNPLTTRRIYCTWNYDFFADIDEQKILGQIPILKEHFSQVEFLQIDDGYQSCHQPGQRAMIDLCYGDLKHPFDPMRFPDGPKGLADRIKEAGLRPAIWLGLWASNGSQMLKDHPDWVLCDDTGTPLTFHAYYGGTTILDPSVDGVRDYLDRMCHTVFGEWGFEGVKLDFSSFAFNGKRVRYRHPGRSGVERRHELETIFRRHLPADGFFGWCVVAGTAQPFLAQADYFRNAVDINKGDWPAIKRVAMWTANTNLLLQERPCLPNLDSIGWSEEFDETSWQTWLNFCAVAGGALEVSGDLRKLDCDRLRRLAATLKLSDPSCRVRCLDLSHETPAHPPAVWLAEGPSGTLLGLFNWTDGPLKVALPTGLDVAGAYDAWTHAPGTPSDLMLQPRASVLWRLRS